MKLPISWLKEYVDIPASITELSDKFTAIGHMQDHLPETVAGDTVLDLEVRQNRSDCLSIIGLAREISSVLKTKLKLPRELKEHTFNLPSTSQVDILDTDLCYRFNTVQINGVSIKESPVWLKNRLEAYGIKSINNVVDITNYVMVEIGEPLHAFDIAKLKQPHLIIRRAQKGEIITVIGGKKITLTDQDLVVASEEKPVALAGIIGGDRDSISITTKDILLESATYNQASIRRSSLRHSLRTEASLRHEKFLHPTLSEIALKRAVALIEEIAGGTAVSNTDSYPTPTKNVSIDLRIDRLNYLGGVVISLETAQEILERLSISTKIKSNSVLECAIPYFRTDIQMEEDLIEEVLRINGYEEIPNHLPYVPAPNDIQSPSYVLEEEIRNVMVSAGFDEQITEPLVNETVSVRKSIVLENSLNADKSMLRTTLKGNLLKCIDEQKKYRKDTINLFEIGNVYYFSSNKYIEEKTLSGISAGPTTTYSKMKGVVEYVFNRLGYEYDSTLAKIERILPGNHTYFFEILIQKLLTQKKLTTKNVYTNPPHVILEDLSIIVPATCRVGELIAQLVKSSPLVMQVALGEDPRDVQNGNKSVFLHITYHNEKKSLSADDIKPAKQALVKIITDNFNGRLR